MASKPSKIRQNPKTWGEHIKKRRLELRLFQRQVAELLDVDQCTVTNWEKHRTEPQLNVIPKIIEFLGYNPLPRAQTLSERLLQYRKNQGLSQKELAKRIGIDPTTLSRLERGKGKRLFRAVARKVATFMAKRLAWENLAGISAE